MDITTIFLCFLFIQIPLVFLIYYIDNIINKANRDEIIRRARNRARKRRWKTKQSIIQANECVKEHVE